LDDISIFEKLKENPKDGINDVIDKYSGLVYSIIYSKLSKLGTEEDIKECISDVFLGFYNQIDKIDLEKGTLKAYIAMIANNKAIDFYRRLEKNSIRTDKYEELSQYKDKSAAPETEIIKKEERKELIDAIHSLGEPDSEIFIRKYYMGQKTKEIANILSIRDNTVDKKISRGLKKLRVLIGGGEYGR